MKINLSEIPAEGRQYDFDRQSGELNEILADLVQDNAYEVKLFIRPMGNAFEMTGSVKTELPEICSKCGWDLQMPIQRQFHEFLVQEEEEPRNSQSVHGNGAIDFLSEGPTATTFRGNQFDAGSYAHEVVALAEPSYPSCGVAECEHLAEVEARQAELQRAFEQAAEEKGHPGFSALKQLKVDSGTKDSQ